MKRRVRCPLPGHEDSSPSAVFFQRTQTFHCSVCTPGRAIPLEELRRRVKGKPLDFDSSPTPPSLPPARAHSSFKTDLQVIERLWLASRARARDDRFADDPADEEVWSFLHKRNLSEAFELAELGILSRDQELTEEFRAWLRGGYRLLLPLESLEEGRIVGLQARTIRQKKAGPKALTTSGTRLRGAAFLNDRARRALLSREPFAPEAARAGAREVSSAGPREVFLLAEGLTDHLALSIHAPCAVVSVPGAQLAAGLLGPWVRGQTLILALDQDEAGERASADLERRAKFFRAGRVERLGWPEGAKDACDTLALVGEEAFGAELEWRVAAAREEGRRGRGECPGRGEV